MHRSTTDITTTVSTTGTEAVAEAASAVARCADPATCGSEWAAGADAGSGTVAVTCSRCGLTGILDLDLVAELDAAEAQA